MWSIRVALAFALWLTASNMRAHAEPLLDVTWTSELAVGTEPCTKPEGVEARVLALASAESATEIARFDVRMEAPAAGGYRLFVRRAGASDARPREFGSCDEAREAAVLIMATALGSEGEQASSPAEASAEPPPQASIVVEMGVPPRFTLSLSALLDYGTLPGLAGGPLLDVSYATGLLRAGVSGSYLPARAAPDVPRPAAIRVDAFAFALHGAALFRFAKSAFGPRAQVELGALRGRARGVEESVTRSTFWAALLAGLELEVWFHSRVGMQLLVLAGPALRRPRFALQDEAAVYTSAPLVLRGALGVTVRIDPKD